MSPIYYFPQALGIAIGRGLSGSALLQFTLGRLANLLIWAGLCFFAIKRIPYNKWVFLVLALSPMFIHQAASYSPDASVYGFSFYFIAFVIDLAQPNDATLISSKQKMLLLLFSILLLQGKITNITLLVLLFIIPAKKFQSNKQRWMLLGLVIFTSVFLLLAWNLIGYQNQPKLEGINPGAQLLYFLTKPTAFIMLMISNFQINLGFYFISWIGKLGWLSLELPWFVYFFYMVVLVLSMFLGEKPPNLNREQQLIVWITFFSSILVVFVVMLLIWTPVKGGNILGKITIFGVQGRYFIPIIPLIFFGFNQINIGKQIVQTFGKILTPLLLFFILAVSTQVIVSEYFTVCRDQSDVAEESICKTQFSIKNEEPIGNLSGIYRQNLVSQCSGINEVRLYFNKFDNKSAGSFRIILRDKDSFFNLGTKTVDISLLKGSFMEKMAIPPGINSFDKSLEILVIPENGLDPESIAIMGTKYDFYQFGFASRDGQSLEKVMGFTYYCDSLQVRIKAWFKDQFHLDQ